MDKLNFNVPKLPGWVSALIKVGLLGGATTYTLSKSLYNVEGGQRAVVFNRIVGVKEKVYPEGTHFLIPWFERPTIYDVRARPYIVEGTSGSHDLQTVNIALRILTHPVADQLPTIYRSLGENFNERVLPSIVHETLKAVVAQYNASQLITQRGEDQIIAPAEVYNCKENKEKPLIYKNLLLSGSAFHRSHKHEGDINTSLSKYDSQINTLIFPTDICQTVSQEIRSLLIKRAASFNIALDDVSITSLTFGREFTAAIKAKQIAAQEAERAKFVVEKAEQEKKSAIIRAQGEATSAELIGKAIADNPSFITLRRIEDSKDVAQIISNSANRVYLNSDDLLLNLQGMNLSISSLRK